ncbi:MULTISPECIES: peptide chain release factor 2 [Deefgea]|uniref:Peptide chain release factor 2 n=1 Tax=Deefgea chitinilytica TaxID=570276 RepID=A0ABS2C9E3_9NEIS|nr:MULTISPECIES: peptide chain release factor 2 [Deefgea]MBM5570781.1 peptide chain release factor 2 [Deefgea chitinilytica]MBM9888010.1 peptide chain release factor 2 [Deefgea sp. CFH1-16]
MEAEQLNQIENQLKELGARADELKRYLDYPGKVDRLEEVVRLSEAPETWNDPKKAQEVGRERKALEDIVLVLDRVTDGVTDSLELFEMAKAEADYGTAEVIAEDYAALEAEISKLEFRRMFNNPMDPMPCFIDIQSGAGGTEAQDWAGMLLRMYVRYGERKGFAVEVMEQSDGDIVGISQATIKLTGDYAYGFLRTETGVHRLVRCSPYDSNNRRHTSFASVFVYPEVDDSFEIDINPSDVRTDTYRASGAGGQHINKTDSAVRLTHIPTNTVVQCQNDRSQHKNRDEAWKMLRAKLYELELRKRMEAQQSLEATKSDIGWGHQIRSYVFDQSRIKDLRTSYEVGNIKGVMDGDLDNFIAASLKQGV